MLGFIVLLLPSFFAINKIITNNFIHNAETRIESSAQISKNYINTLIRNNKQNIKAFAVIAELNHALNNHLTLRLPFILEKYRSDYGFDSIQLYDIDGNILAESGERMGYIPRQRIRTYLNMEEFGGIIVEGGGIFFVSSSVTLNRQAILIAKNRFDNRIADGISEIININVALYREGNIIASSVFDDYRGEGFDTNYILNTISVTDIASHTISHDNQNLMTFIFFPITDYYNNPAGILSLGLSMELLSALQRQTQNLLIIIFIIGIILSLVVGLLFSKRLTNPLEHLTEWAKAVSSGDLEHKRDIIATNDEINDLAEAFSLMIFNLKKSFDKIQKQNIELKKIDKLKTDLISNVSHELRTPITTIFGSMELLVSGEVENDKEVIAEFYQGIFAEIKTLKKIINNFIMISVIEQNDYYLKEADMLSFFKNFSLQITDFEYKELIENKNITVNIAALDKLENKNCVTNIDETYLNHLLSEIFHNAIIFNKDNGTIDIDIELNKTLEIKIRDSGIGIEKKHTNKIFDNFYRVENDRTYSISGVGLGLTVARLICNQLGYNINIESEPGKFTEVRISGIKYKTL
jgi:signal transduction histidine kinase